ncbi:hypothetical protein GCM10010413_05990 [Promicromonospora sukumoe]|uniref:Uncharacterized protein n=1 Tax=Promicromonospora sukumoe TaxID=88382 RepID=A0A7W3J4L7_9MICO|nr:hypothetical protein [Promicromonospora sukumoe]MBA8806191.1 hypothetical protein [Promicromonospora sukumoe]
MSDDEGATRAPELNPSPEPRPAADASNGAAADASNGSATTASATDDAAEPQRTQVLTAESPAPSEMTSHAADAPGSPEAPAAPNALGVVVAFVKTHATILVLVVLLIAAMIWGALGVVSTNDWQSRAAALSSDLKNAEQTLADARATIDDLEIAKERAETTATACIGAIDDADAMLEVSAELDDKTVDYLEGLDDFMTALAAGNISAAESIGSEIDSLSAQMEELGDQIDGHMDDYADTAEGCHVDDAQGV